VYRSGDSQEDVTPEAFQRETRASFETRVSQLLMERLAIFTERRR
jgi:hypothetical protein